MAKRNVIPTLVSMCQELLGEYVYALEEIGPVPWDLIGPVLRKADGETLAVIEDANPEAIGYWPMTELWRTQAALANVKPPIISSSKYPDPPDHAPSSAWRAVYEGRMAEKQQWPERLKKTYEQEAAARRTIRALPEIPTTQKTRVKLIVPPESISGLSRVPLRNQQEKPKIVVGGPSVSKPLQKRGQKKALKELVDFALDRGKTGAFKTGMMKKIAGSIPVRKLHQHNQPGGKGSAPTVGRLANAIASQGQVSHLPQAGGGITGFGRSPTKKAEPPMNPREKAAAIMAARRAAAGKGKEAMKAATAIALATPSQRRDIEAEARMPTIGVKSVRIPMKAGSAGSSKLGGSGGVSSGRVEKKSTTSMPVIPKKKDPRSQAAKLAASIDVMAVLTGSKHKKL